MWLVNEWVSIQMSGVGGQISELEIMSEWVSETEIVGVRAPGCSPARVHVVSSRSPRHRRRERDRWVRLLVCSSAYRSNFGYREGWRRNFLSIYCQFYCQFFIVEIIYWHRAAGQLLTCGIIRQQWFGVQESSWYGDWEFDTDFCSGLSFFVASCWGARMCFDDLLWVLLR